MAPLALPPHVSHTSVPLSPSTALTYISAYLKESESAPHLHPDALLTTSGPTYSAASGSTGGLVLHNLRRVEAGLKGERLAPEPEKEGDDTVLDGLIAETEGRGRKRKAGRRDGATIADGDAGAGTEDAADGVEGWQDPEEYRRETEQDGIQQGEIGDRNNFIANDGDPSIRATAPQGVDGEAAGKKVGRVDKEARKKAKKERAKAENKERAAKRVKDKA
ncbi:hypothetical protein H2201_001123 [Coniosporium apollinis]|uniref:Uncharacterized protein n=1 Tax=Coniosporium apollinis TaxID=61459 RepID=A0ABQ9P3C2_9PEZI|nr:hypothetical protein H2201_001123 [Coniosporium apollinis]